MADGSKRLTKKQREKAEAEAAAAEARRLAAEAAKIPFWLKQKPPPPQHVDELYVAKHEKPVNGWVQHPLRHRPRQVS